MIKVGIIGCGRIADQHAIEIVKMQGVRISAACDGEVLMAKQLAERFDAQAWFSDANEMLESAKPDIVHITTPPQSHYPLAKLCLRAGCHVFVEKPFTLNTAEAEELIRIATENDLKVTVGNNAQFSHAAMRMRQLIREGYLGGKPVHMESIWCYPFTDPGYARAILGDANHWIRSLPGRYLHDIISHGISRITEFLESEAPKVIAHGSVSPLLRSIGETDIIDELRVIIGNGNGQTAYFTFSSQITPPLKQFRIYGPKNGLILDHEHQTVIKVTGNYKYYLNHFIPGFLDAREYLGNSIHNMKELIRGRLYFESGRKYLIESFYRAVTEGKPLPIPYREILLTSRIMDGIFLQVCKR